MGARVTHITLACKHTCVTALCDALLVSCPAHDEGLVVTSAFLCAGRSSRCGRIPSLCRPGGDGGDDGLAVPLLVSVQREGLDTSLFGKRPRGATVMMMMMMMAVVFVTASPFTRLLVVVSFSVSPRRCHRPNFLASEFGIDDDDDDDGCLHKSPSSHPLCPDLETHEWNNAVIWICKHKLNVVN